MLQDKFDSNLIEASKVGKPFVDFFRYIGENLFTRKHTYAMMDSASRQLHSIFDNTEADMEVRSYLEAINCHAANVLPVLS